MSLKPQLHSVLAASVPSVTIGPSSTGCLPFSNVQDRSYNPSMDRGRPDLHKSVPSVQV